MRISMTVHAGGLRARVQAAQRALDARVLADCNAAAPRRSGALIRSGRASGQGMATYGAPHARAVYYGDGDGARWFEGAKAVHADEWIACAREAFRRG